MIYHLCDRQKLHDLLAQSQMMLMRAVRAGGALMRGVNLGAPEIAYLALGAAFIFMCGVTFDDDVAHAVLSLPSWLIDLNVMMSKLGDSAYIFALSILWTLCGFIYAARAVRRRVAFAWLIQAQRAVYILSVNLCSGLFSIFTKHVIGRARPSDVGPWHFEPFSVAAKYASLPSGHSITAFATAFALALIYPRLRIGLFVIAVLVGVSRIIIHAHFVSDVMVGACVGLFWAYVVARAMAQARLGFTFAQNHFNARGQYLLSHLRATSLFGETR